jgi:hypothetical protein
MTRNMTIRRYTGLPLLAALAALAGQAPTASAAELEEAQLYLELNDTDGDLGIHALVDGGPYTRLEIEDPRGRTILQITAQGRLARQGLTELFFESAEPDFDELPPQQFFQRFPEGIYEIDAEQGKQEFEAEAELSHVLAAPPSGITVNGLPAAEDCDAPALPVVNDPVTIDWAPVTTSHPTLGTPGPVEIVRYQLFVEQDDLKFGVDLPPEVTEFVVPAGIVAHGGTFKFEIIARAGNLNNTAIESCFEVP